MRVVSSEVRDALAANRLITAAHNLVKTSAVIDNDLAQVEALGVVRQEMLELRDVSFVVLFDRRTK